jgi:hypothetical protein
VVGDIAGHGLDAVTGMVAVRNSLRGLAITGASPATLLDWLNRAAAHFTDGVLGTAICGLYDPADRTLRWARAGHLPPLLVRDGRAEQLPLPEGLLLGADPDCCCSPTASSNGATSRSTRRSPACSGPPAVLWARSARTPTTCLTRPRRIQVTTRAWSRSGFGDQAPALRHDTGVDARILG